MLFELPMKKKIEYYDYMTGFMKINGIWKYTCFKCGLQGREALAVWYYMPHFQNKAEEENYFCDNCISRGCSCNLIIGSDSEEELDERGRQLPCIEYDYSETGYDYR